MKTNLTKLAGELAATGDHPDDLRDLRPDRDRDYIKFLEKLASDGMKKIPQGDFYMVVVLEVHKDITSKNCFQFRGRACRGVETPKFNSDVWKFERDTGQARLLWSLPTRKNAWFMYKHRHEVLPKYYPLLMYVVDFYEGKLHMLCDEENEKAAKVIYG